MEALRQELRLVEMAETGLVWRGGEGLRDDQPEALAARLVACDQRGHARHIDSISLVKPARSVNIMVPYCHSVFTCPGFNWETSICLDV